MFLNLNQVEIGNNRIVRFGNNLPSVVGSGLQTFNGNASVAAGLSTILSSNLTIVGNLTTFGTLSLSPTAVLVVTGELTTVSGGVLIVSNGAVISVNGVLVVGVGSSLFAILTSSPGTVTTISVPIASFSQMQGTFTFENVVGNFTGSNCYSFGSPMPVQTQSSLSLTVSIQYTCASDDGLSTGALIGVVVGCSVAGVTVVAIVIGIIVKRRKDDINMSRMRVAFGNDQM